MDEDDPTDALDGIELPADERGMGWPLPPLLDEDWDEWE